MQSKRVAGEVRKGLTPKKPRLEVEIETAVKMTLNGVGMEIDEDLHSRQLAVYGRETMRRLLGANIFISGLNGLGVEIAKNVILAGVKSVTLHDTKPVQLSDLSSQFYLTEADIGKNRAIACALKLEELNKAVAISVVSDEIEEEFLGNFQAVVFTDLLLEKAVKFDAYCHKHNPPVAFIKGEVRGVFGSVFCDFGPSFTVVDTDGELPFSGIVASISNEKDPLITLVDDERVEFLDGDLVTFSEVKGMTKLNDGKLRKVKNVRPHSFQLEEDTTAFPPYEGGGLVIQVKQPKVLQFKPLGEALTSPGEFLLSDFGKFDRPPLLHLAFRALDQFKAENGRWPKNTSDEDGDKVVALTHAFNEKLGDQKVETVDKELVKKLAANAGSDLNPMAAMFGGIIGQEVVKACSGKFHPLFQFFYFDSLESLPSEFLTSEDLALTKTRYDGQVAAFGQNVQDRLANARVFLVGAGALGCEFLKNLALMGVACGERGSLTITDDDVIEKSNLSRQFLFRDWNIGQAKSTVAAAAAKSINPELKVTALQARVSPSTEDVFNDAFWEGIDVVVNALDNVNARLYVDSRCLYFQKPLLESGTLGTKCNTQVVVPHETENYGASRDPPERQAPMCTLHSFPHNIDHCLTWARSEFEGLLEKTPADVNAFLDRPAEFLAATRASGDAAARETLERVLDALDTDRCHTFQDCVAWARLRFEDYFVNRVKQLTFTFPEDSKTSSGTPFWSAPKRFPTSLSFDVSDPSYLNFVKAGAILRAETYGIPQPDWVADPQKFAAAVASVPVEPFQPKEGVKIVTDEKATSVTTSVGDDEAVIDALAKQLEAVTKELPTGFRLVRIEFEKDDDTNCHMDLIAGLANMRARNYVIPEVDKLQAKLIAGRIIPAVATTTAMATGLVCLELYKVLQGLKAEKCRNTFANLALPLFSMAEPIAPKTLKHRELTWSIWDRWILEGDITIRELLQWFSAKGITAYSISCGHSLLYNNIFPKHKERMDRKVSELAMEVAKLQVPPSRRHFDIVVACEDEDDNDLDIPLVSIRFR